MKKSLTIFLQIVIVAVAIGAIFLLLWEPRIEGRNIGTTNFEIYFEDPFLAYAFLASIPFFAGLFNGFKMLSYIRENNSFTEATLKALRNIKYCATALVLFALGAQAWLVIFNRAKDDIAGGVFMSLLLIAIFGITVSVARMFEKTVQKAVDIKSENDLTV